MTIKITSREHMERTLGKLGAPDDLRKAVMDKKTSPDCTVVVSQNPCRTADNEPGHWATITCKNSDGSTSSTEWCSTGQPTSE
jgi:hypothetical protein